MYGARSLLDVHAGQILKPGLGRDEAFDMLAHRAGVQVMDDEQPRCLVHNLGMQLGRQLCLLFRIEGCFDLIQKGIGFWCTEGTPVLRHRGNYLRLDFGESYFRSISVVDLVLEKMPVSISLGLWSTLIAYAISIPLGIAKATRDGTRFDTWTSALIIVAYAIPGFLFAILLLVVFAGGSYFQWHAGSGQHDVRLVVPCR